MVLPAVLDQTNQINLINRSNETNRSIRLRWYALWTKACHEKRVRDRLASTGITPLLPTLIKISQWRDRKKKIEMPLFSCYCFAQFEWADRLLVLKTPGVLQIVGNGKGPEPVQEEEIQAIQALMASRLPYDAHPYLKGGDPVQVIRGTLEGIRGILVRKSKPCRLVISVNLIRQAASVEIDAGDVAPL